LGSDVYFVRVKNGENFQSIINKIGALFKKAGLDTCISENDLVAVKMHFGEKGNTTHIAPEFVRPVVEAVKKKQGKPFLTDTNVLYRSERNDAVTHLHLAQAHGFTIENTGAPVVIADGLLGSGEDEVSIHGQLFDKVSLAKIALESNSIVVMTHVTGHLSTGIGGTIKNLGMGFASRKGKLRQHAGMNPYVSKKYCTGCAVCIRWCPADAISMDNTVAVIDDQACIGCGECIAVCRFDAVKHDWGVASAELQKRIAEHALGVVSQKPGKIGCINFLVSVTKDCDCLDINQKPIIRDIGILASKDPVAIDAASLDLIQKNNRKNLKLTDMTYPKLDPWVQIRHGESIGLGQSKYQLIEV
jgi:uncharacterized Fe-S center protein